MTYIRKSQIACCSVCNTQYSTRSFKTKFCSNKCKQKKWRLDHGDIYFDKYYQLANRNKNCITCSTAYLDTTANNLKIYCSLKCNKTYQIGKSLRTRIRNAIRCKKPFRFNELLGCSVEELKRHLEAQFEPWMSWSNYGRFGWHIDHVIPLTNFNLNDNEQLKKACHYTNLQPLQWRENIVKSNK